MPPLAQIKQFVKNTPRRHIGTNALLCIFICFLKSKNAQYHTTFSYPHSTDVQIGHITALNATEAGGNCRPL